MLLSASGIQGKLLWSQGDTSNTIAVNQAGIYTLYHKRTPIAGSPSFVTVFKMKMIRHPFLRDSIASVICNGSEAKVPWYADGDVVASSVWEGKNI